VYKIKFKYFPGHVILRMEQRYITANLGI